MAPNLSVTVHLTLNEPNVVEVNIVTCVLFEDN